MIDEVKDIANEAKLIAKGRATGYVFDTKEDMITWISQHITELIVGDNLYIRELDIPDYWWDGNKALQLETQKVDLTEYATTEYVDTKVKVNDIQVAGVSVLNNGVANISVGKGLKFENGQLVIDLLQAEEGAF